MSSVQNNGETTGGVTGRGFMAGQSGNPGGRPKGLARYVRDLVGDDGRRIADFMLGVLEDETERTETRMQAATWLADRGFGKPTQPQEVELSARTYFDPDEVKKGAEWFTAEIRRLSEIRRRSAAASETADRQSRSVRVGAVAPSQRGDNPWGWGGGAGAEERPGAGDP